MRIGLEGLDSRQLHGGGESGSEAGWDADCMLGHTRPVAFHRDSEGLCLSCEFCATLSLT